MDTPSKPEKLDALYVIDRVKNGQTWYLWKYTESDWKAIKTGSLEMIIDELKRQPQEERK